ncbi:MAG: hypothetical protein LBJ24_06200, partial [Treponema sp.]|nr:hypothetical protein [Treponema sp.]
FCRRQNSMPENRANFFCRKWKKGSGEFMRGSEREQDPCQVCQNSPSLAIFDIGVCARRKRHLSAMGGQPVHSGILPPSLADYFIGVCAERKLHLSAMGGQLVHSGILPPSLADYFIGVCVRRKHRPKAVITAWSFCQRQKLRYQNPAFVPDFGTVSLPPSHGRGRYGEIVYNGGGFGLHYGNTITGFGRIVKSAKKNPRTTACPAVPECPLEAG